jgi:hypothetical protein
MPPTNPETISISEKRNKHAKIGTPVYCPLDICERRTGAI